MFNQLIQDNLSEMINLLQNNKVKKAYLFGSVCTDKFTDKSDIDIIVRFNDDVEPLAAGDLWWELYFSLENLLKRPIDLIIEGSLNNPYLKKEVEKNMKEIL